MYEVKFKQKNITGSTVVIVEGIIKMTLIASIIESKYPDLIQFEGINLKKYVAIFEVKDKDFFYICKCQYEDIDGKKKTETYLQQADDLTEARLSLLCNLEYTPKLEEIKETKITKIIH